MKRPLKNSATYQQARTIAALILTGILSISGSLTLITSATANQISQASDTTEVLTEDGQSYRLPRIVASAVLRDISQKTGIPRRQLQITNYQQRTWRNGCLDLPRPNEMCTMALVPGWRVVVTRDNQAWVYHTNNNGRQLRLANADTPISNIPDDFPNSVRNRVSQAAARRLQLSPREVSIIQAERRNWRGGCLELEKPDEACTRNIVPGWRVVAGAKGAALVYHTNESGTQIRLNERESEFGEIPDNNREKVSEAVLQQASELTGLSKSQFEIVQWKQVTTDGCLSLPRPGEACTKIAMQAWEVTVVPRDRQRQFQRLVFRATPDGSQVRLNEAASSFRVSREVTEAVLKDASKWSKIPQSQLRIVKTERRVWGNNCEFGFGQVCPMIYQPTPGWEVTVDSGRQQWVYRVNDKATAVLLDRSPLLGSELARALKNKAVRRFNPPVSVSALRVISTQVNATTRDILATVSNGQKSLNYRIRNFDSAFEIDEVASVPPSGEVVPIPASELPPPLTRGMVFREIRSGGIAGQTFMTVLMDDGRLMRMRLGDANDSERSVRRISPQQLRQIQRLLQRQRNEFQNVNYPPSRGAADFFVYTLTSSSGTVQYNDISSQRLPENLREVIAAWEQITRR
jgi:uncharacterized protein YcnI